MGRVINLSPVSKMLDVTRGPIAKLTALSLPSQKDRKASWTPFEKDLSACRVGLLTTAGLYLEGQAPFDVDSAEGDASFRELPRDLDPARLRVAHAHFPHARFKKDPNVLFPIDRLRELVEEGVLGSLAENFFSFGFGAGLTKEYVDPEYGTAHVVAGKMREDRVDFVLLVPA